MKEQVLVVVVKNVGSLKSSCQNGINDTFFQTRKYQTLVTIGDSVLLEFSVIILMKMFILIRIHSVPITDVIISLTTIL